MAPLFWTGVVVLGPLTFGLLPVTRRRAKVRWAHIWRLAVFASPMAFLFLVMSGAGLTHIGFAGSRFGSGAWMTWPLYAAVSWLAPIWLVLWWTCAVKWYLRMPHALAVGITVVLLPAVLVFSVITVMFLW